MNNLTMDQIKFLKEEIENKNLEIESLKNLPDPLLGKLTLRDHFACAALQGLLAYSHVNPRTGNYHENCNPEIAAKDAYLYANAMIIEREKK